MSSWGLSLHKLGELNFLAFFDANVSRYSTRNTPEIHRYSDLKANGGMRRFVAGMNKSKESFRAIKGPSKGYPRAIGCERLVIVAISAISHTWFFILGSLSLDRVDRQRHHATLHAVSVSSRTHLRKLKSSTSSSSSLSV